MDLRFTDWAENSRIQAIATIVAGDEIHPIGDYNLLKVTPITTRHRRLSIFDSITGSRGHENIAGVIAYNVARHGNNPLHILRISRKNKATQRTCGQTNGNNVA